jgi:sugar transferase (PEP-CTERM/EpsH1 system associated)
MRILCLTPRPPFPPDRGDRLRAFHILRTLSREHELVLLTFVDHRSRLELIEALAKICHEVRVVTRGRLAPIASVLANGWRRLPLQALYYRSRAMNRLVSRALGERRFDAAYVHLFRMAPYLERPESPYRIVDLTDVVSDEARASLPYRSLPSRSIYRIESGRIERYESVVASTSEEVWLISDRERQALRRRCPNADLRVVPNGVDCELFRPLGGEEEERRIVFTGHMGVPHNVDAAVHLAEDILSAVQRRVAGCRLRIVGAHPSRKVRRLERIPGVEVTGFVPDLNLELNRAAAFVAPLRFAAGVQNKVLEAMAAGRPVITSPRVAEGLGATAGRDLLVGRDPVRFADLTVTALADPDLRARLGAAGRRFVEDRFTWDAAADRARAVADHLGVR